MSMMARDTTRDILFLVTRLRVVISFVGEHLRQGGFILRSAFCNLPFFDTISALLIPNRSMLSVQGIFVLLDWQNVFRTIDGILLMTSRFTGMPFIRLRCSTRCNLDFEIRMRHRSYSS